MFGENFLVNTPSTDPKSVVGRNFTVPVSHLTGDKRKQHMKVKFRTTEVKDKQVNTRFNGFEVSKEFISKNVRKGSEKVESINEIKTKDNWLLQVTTISILMRNAKSNIRTKIRKFIVDFLQKESEKSNIDKFVKSVMNSEYQKSIRKKCSKIYPIRFTEINKIEVLKAGEN